MTCHFRELQSRYPPRAKPLLRVHVVRSGPGLLYYELRTVEHTASAVFTATGHELGKKAADLPKIVRYQINKPKRRPR
jgi:hypothetical protein